jgi:hypothetical protein
MVTVTVSEAVDPRLSVQVQVKRALTLSESARPVAVNLLTAEDGELAVISASPLVRTQT